MTVRHRAGRTGDSRGCTREVLSAFKGEVTAVGKGTIERVTRGGDVVGRCACGRTVTWMRALPPPSVSVG
jgi:hypothetical protein